ncbi:MAG: SAM-dependent methyltransferase [Pirellulales bacterium]
MASPPPPPSSSPSGHVADESAPEFLLCACQPGAEAALRRRASERIPVLQPAAWRPGVVTFRLPPGQNVPTAAELVFARGVFHSLGQVRGDGDTALVLAARTLAGERGFSRVHLWHRLSPPGRTEREAGRARPEAIAGSRAAVMAAVGLDPAADPVAGVGDLVLDCIVDAPDRWWVGWHRAGDRSSCWPGGIYPAAYLPLPDGTVSRAWLKLTEAIDLFDIPFVRGQRAVELGASPGGACQRLLAAGLDVVGVDPALVDPRVGSLPRFTQWRMRARDVPLERFRGVDWLVVDMNIDPKSTLAAIERVANARQVQLAGIVATLKIPDWSRAEELPAWLDAFRSWGFLPRARQLSSAGREVCVVATRAVATRVGNLTARRARRRPVA